MTQNQKQLDCFIIEFISLKPILSQEKDIQCAYRTMEIPCRNLSLNYIFVIAKFVVGSAALFIITYTLKVIHIFKTSFCALLVHHIGTEGIQMCAKYCGSYGLYLCKQGRENFF